MLSCIRWLLRWVVFALFLSAGSFSSGLAQAPTVETPKDYRIGPRDSVAIAVWGHSDLSKEYPVDADGFLPFPLLGRVKASGLTTKELAARLRDLLEKDYLVNPQVIVSVKDYLSQKVYVIGEAERRGLVYLTRPTTILEIISGAGGVTKSAGKELVVVKSHGRDGRSPAGSTIVRLNIEKIQAGDPKENIYVQDEDMILVPKAHAFFVIGEVKNAGTFPLDKDITVFEALTLAGGFSDRAAPSAVKLIRRTSQGKEETVSLNLVKSGGRDRDVKLRDGDTILVPRGNTFFVFGEVKNPGAYLLEKETNILEAITRAGGFTEKASPGRTRVIRETTQGQQMINVDMNDIVKRGQRDKAILLRENDVIVVPESFF